MTTLRLAKRILSMSPAAWEIMTKALIFCCSLLFCAYLLLMHAGPMNADNYDTYLLARELYTLPQAVLLIATLAGVIIEERAVM